MCSRWEVADSKMAAGEESRAHIGQPGDDGRCSGSARRPVPPWLVVPEKENGKSNSVEMRNSNWTAFAIGSEEVSLIRLRVN